MIVILFGTRPEAIKLGPVVAACRARHLPVSVICTGQHTDLLDGTPAQTDLAGGRSLGIQATGEVLKWLSYAQPVVEDAIRDATLVVVQGDTMSALVGARAASGLGIPVAHVEAGIRSGSDSDPWPEEVFRKEITQLATWHLTPTTHTFANLVSEGVPADRITITGNSVVSAIARYSEAVPVKVPDLSILFTMHRREWRLHGIKGVLEGFHEACLVYPEVTFHWPLHPAVARDLSPTWLDRLPPNAQVTGPLPYRRSVRLVANSLGVGTDSGGLQEEAAVLGTPCAVFRTVTDRPESVWAGVAKTYPPTAEGILNGLTDLRESRLLRQVAPVFGGVESADLIAKQLDEALSQSTRIKARMSS